jgi:hypothetical protein
MTWPGAYVTNLSRSVGRRRVNASHFINDVRAVEQFVSW